jgi:hypothetical protein
MSIKSIFKKNKDRIIETIKPIVNIINQIYIINKKIGKR